MKNQLHIVGISDLHGLPKHTYIPQCDVVTISGDFSELRYDRQVEQDGRLCDWITNKFIPWMIKLPCKRVIIMPGNHDFITERPWFMEWFNRKLKEWDDYYRGSNIGQPKPSEKIVYLCYSTYEYGGYTFYGCPASDIFNWAWSTNGDYTKYLVPEGVDVMLVHQAPDYMNLGTSDNGMNFGSNLLMNALQEHPENLPKLLLCGHIHTGNHKPIIWDIPYEDSMRSIMMTNVSTLNEDYQEWFYVRNFRLMGTEDDKIQIDTWVSPAEGPSDIEHYNKRESFVV